MKTIPALLEPGKLAEERIVSQSDLINRSILMLEILVNEFKTHDGSGLFKMVYRRRAVTALAKLDELRALGKAYAEYRTQRLCSYEVGFVPDTGELAKLGFMYVAQLANYRDHVINAFAYDPETNRYDHRIGKKNWDWMITGLMVPVLKTYK